MSGVSSLKAPVADGHCLTAIPVPAPAAAASLQGGPALAGLVPFSSVDWPGQLAAVLFIAGCPWRCGYCHNPHLQRRHAAYAWPAVLDWLKTRAGLLDSVVFSGGDPLSEARLPELAAAVRALGFKVGLHTAGIYPRRLATLLPRLDWVGLDIKADAAGHDALVGRPGGLARVQASLALLLGAGVPFECRTTWDPACLSEPRLLALASALAAQGVRHYAVQACRTGTVAVPGASLSAPARQALESSFETFCYREG
ncbi:anaerobic ribonucleoside-triphosphate reductase activating protein [Cupriavidus sp. LEh25]|uniref:anaerobic ribonucleoside-triphosphate reductase activating protein n=1 Tax=Cupriavidus consociatus TaxID=2821357 RepID=UPI001AE379FE|nr:anaerobic ribonucleoside-triphosphate reductase activating protein [Cupriavidus sp. LEh25]